MKRCLFAIAATLVLWNGAQAQNAVHYASVGNWTIMADQSLGYGCFIAVPYSGGMELRIGLDPRSGSAYAMIGNPAWQSLEPGKEYQLQFRIDSRAPWGGAASALAMGSLPALFISFTEAKFLGELARGHGLHVTYQGREIMALSLQGSYAALLKMVECQAVVVGGGSPSTADDPFAGGTSDPFAR